VTEAVLLEMRRGDLILLDESNLLRPLVEALFFAVLACPDCGALGLITVPQYSGIHPVTCGADDCSCRFRIMDKSRFEFSPVN
jgi:hypothetical protein